MRLSLSISGQMGLKEDPFEEPLCVIFWGVAGNGKSTLFKWLMMSFSDWAFSLQKDTTRNLKIARPGEELLGEYRSVPVAQFHYRATHGHYRYKPEPVTDKGDLHYTGIPKVEFFPNIPPQKPLVAGIFPLDRRHPISFPGRRTIHIFVHTEDMDILRDRLWTRSPGDIETFNRKIKVNEDFRAGRLRVDPEPPHYYFPELYDHVIYTDKGLYHSIRQLANIVPGVKEYLGGRF